VIAYELRVLNRAMASDRPMLDFAARQLAADFQARHGWLPGPLVVDVEIDGIRDVPSGTRFLVVTSQ
jgi:hypothetical protein